MADSTDLMSIDKRFQLPCISIKERTAHQLCLISKAKDRDGVFKAGLCNGSTCGSDPHSLGSNPSPAAPSSSSGQDAGLSRRKQGFDSP